MARSALLAGLRGLFEDEGREILRTADADGFGALLDELDREPGSPLEALTALRDRWEAGGDLDLAVLATLALVERGRTELGDGAGATLAEVAHLGGLYVRLGAPEDGGVLIERAWEYSVEHLQPGDRHRARVALELGTLRVGQDRGSEAVFPLREAARELQRTDPDAASEASFRLGLVMVEFGSAEAGIRLVEAAVRQARTASPGPALPERVGALARLLSSRQSAKDVEGLFREAIEAARHVHGEQSPQMAEAQAALGALLLNVPGRIEEALGLMDVAVSLLLGSVGPLAPATRTAAAQLVERLIDVARVAGGRRDRQLALVCVERAEAVTRSVFGPTDSRLHRIQELAERL